MNKTFKRRLTPILLIIILALFGLTYYNSIKAEQLFRQQLSELNQEAGITISLESYQRRFFSAEATTSAQNPLLGTLRLHHLIRHFAWGGQMETRLIEAPLLEQAFIAQPPLTEFSLTSKAGLTGQLSNVLSIPELHLQNGTLALNIENADASWHKKLDQPGQFALSADAFDVQHGDEQFKLQQLEISATAADNFRSTSTLTTAALSLADAEQKLIQAGSLAATTSTELIDGKMVQNSELTVQQIDLLGEQFDNARLDMTLSAIDPELLAQIQGALHQLQRQALLGQEQGFESQMQLLGLYMQLIHSGVTLEVNDLSLQQQDSDFAARGHLKLPDSQSDFSGFSFTALDIAVQLGVDPQLFKSAWFALNRARQQEQNRAVSDELAEQLLGGLEQKGLLSKNQQGRYSLDYQKNENGTILNGKSL